MSTAIQIFNHPEFGDVRTIGDFENPRFCLADVCRILELPQVAKVVQRLGDEVLSRHPIADNMGRMQEMYFVNEDGLYDVILDSRKPNAKKFRKWITSEVIPSIRKHGVYMTAKTAEEILSNPDFIIELAQQVKAARAQIEVLNTQVAELQARASYCDVVLQCKELVTTSVIAKDYGYSAKAFNKLLHELGVQFRRSDIWLLIRNTPRKAGRKPKLTSTTIRTASRTANPTCIGRKKGGSVFTNFSKPTDTFPRLNNKSTPKVSCQPSVGGGLRRAFGQPKRSFKIEYGRR